MFGHRHELAAHQAPGGTVVEATHHVKAAAMVLFQGIDDRVTDLVGQRLQRHLGDRANRDLRRLTQLLIALLIE